MKRDFLKGLELSDEVIDSIMSEHGKSINEVKAKFADYDEIKESLAKANETLEKFKDYDQTKADVEKYKAEVEQVKAESLAKISKMELENKVRDFTGSKKFVNDETKEFYSTKLVEELSKDDAKGKSIDDIFGALTKDKTNIFVEENKPVAPVVPTMKDDGNSKDALASVAAARAVMGLK